MFEDLQGAIKEERRGDFNQLLANFMELGKEAGAAVERSAQHSREYDAKLAALDEQRAALTIREEELDRGVAALAQRERACAASEGALLKQAADLAVREENAAGGFLKERVETTKQLHIELDALAAQRLDLQAELARLSENTRQDLEKKVGEQLQALRERQLTLDQQAADQDAAAARIESAERAFRRGQRTSEQLETMIRSELEVEFESMRADKGAASLKLGQQLKQLRDDNDALNERIDEYRDMEDALAGRSPAAVLDDLDLAQRTVRDHVRTIRELESARSRDDSDAVRVERDRLAEELREMRPELADLKQQNHRDRMGAMEKEQ